MNHLAEFQEISSRMSAWRSNQSIVVGKGQAEFNSSTVDTLGYCHLYSCKHPGCHLCLLQSLLGMCAECSYQLANHQLLGAISQVLRTSMRSADLSSTR